VPAASGHGGETEVRMRLRRVEEFPVKPCDPLVSQRSHDFAFLVGRPEPAGEKGE
jgi:hypothetical protein